MMEQRTMYSVEYMRTGPTYSVGTVPGAHDTFMDPRKIFHFNFSSSQKKDK